MERLTFRNGRGYVILKGDVGNYGGCSFSCVIREGIRKLESAFEKLAEYEDLEEQGKLLKLPCAVGDTVYRVRKCEAQSCERCGGHTWVGNCYTDYMGRIFVERFGYRHLDSFGKTVFLTHEEAEEALKRMEDGK